MIEKKRITNLTNNVELHCKNDFNSDSFGPLIRIIDYMEIKQSSLSFLDILISPRDIWRVYLASMCRPSSFHDIMLLAVY